MALMNCPECGKEVSDSAEQCPHCGFPIAKQNDRTPRKIKGLEICFIISLIACIVFLSLKVYFLGAICGAFSIFAIIVVFLLNRKT